MKKRNSLFLLLFLFSVHTFGFGPMGHQIVADIAYKNVNCKTKKKIDQLLGKRGIIYTSSWADEIKSDNEYAYSYNWHFQNLKDSLQFEDIKYLMKNPKAEGKHLFFALDSISKTLKKGQENKEALKFIVHFVGDLHQPLHLGRFSDLGGNKIEIKWFGNRIRLHQLWDSQIVDERKFSYTEYSQYLQDKYKKERKFFKKQSLENSIWETYELQQKIYSYDYTNLNAYLYIYQFKDDKDRQLYKAGIQLAKLLDKIFK